MNTLGKAITQRFFKNESGFDLLQNDWARNWQNKEWRDSLTPTHFFLYAALRGKDWRKGFTPITNDVKLSNGQRPMQVVEQIYSDLEFIAKGKEGLIEALGSEVTCDSVAQLLKFLPLYDNLLGGPSYVDRRTGVIDKAA